MRRGTARGRFKHRTLPSSALMLAVAMVVVWTGALQPARAQSLEVWGNPTAEAVQQAPTEHTWIDAASGTAHAIALRKDGTLHSWGNESHGCIAATPTASGFLDVAAGTWHSLALDGQGKIHAWGYDSHGQVSAAPIGSGFSRVIGGGHSHSIALSAAGVPHSWGDDTYGVVSGGPTTPCLDACATWTSSTAILADGSLVSWGEDKWGVVSQTPAGSDFMQVAGSPASGHVVALRSDGSIAAWGRDHAGQVSGTPAGVGFVAVAAGNTHSAALRSDGTVVAWGDDQESQVSSAPTKSDYVGIEGGGTYTITILDPDCNGNGQPDSEDIYSGYSPDCDGNGVPDECDLAGDPYGDINGDGVPDVCVPPSLSADLYELSVSSGGVQTLQLKTPSPAGIYLILGSTSGTYPGVTSGSFTLPLNVDNYLLHTAVSPNSPPLAGSLGGLQPDLPGFGGKASAAFVLPAGLDPALVGLTAHHAFVSLGFLSGQVNFVSNAIPVIFQP